MPDFDDFDLDRTPDREGAPRPYRPSPSPPPRGRLFPALLALLAIVAVGLLAVVFFVFRTPAGRKASVATPSPPPLDFLAPKQRFRAGSRGRRTTPDPRGFEGYNTFAHVVASLDAQACARGYRTLEPPVETAYRELGPP